jgi:hypothetical protein
VLIDRLCGVEGFYELLSQKTPVLRAAREPAPELVRAPLAGAEVLRADDGHLSIGLQPRRLDVEDEHASHGRGYGEICLDSICAVAAESRTAGKGSEPLGKFTRSWDLPESDFEAVGFRFISSDCWSRVLKRWDFALFRLIAGVGF